ncbi:hypothetical protein KEM54_006025 [Ascosphaera aggregata]|nr:hypothetical protein KEM54_006025 [Ascosphaera aggregata]
MTGGSVLQGRTVVLAGTFGPYSHATIKSKIEEEGGKLSETVHDQCTHLITSNKELSKKHGKKSKISQALNLPEIKVVSLEWLINSIDKQACEDEQAYLLLAASTDNAEVAEASGKTSDVVEYKTVDPAEKKRALGSKNDAGEGSADEPSNKSNKKVKKELSITDDQQRKPASSRIHIPADDGSQFKDSHVVYVQEDGTAWDATLNQTNSVSNNNKFYILQILKPLSGEGDYVLWYRWGRVGEHGQILYINYEYISSAIAELKLKFKSKTGLSWEKRFDPPKPKKYAFIERNYEDSGDGDDHGKAATAIKSKGDEQTKPPVEPAKSKLPPQVQECVRLIFNQDHFQSTMAMISYDANKLPLGKLSQRTVKNGFLILKSLANCLAEQTATSPDIVNLSNQYFSVIPHSFGRYRPPILNTNQMIQKEVELLDTLTDMGIAAEIMQIASKIDDTLKHIFRMEREGEKERFQKSPYANFPNSNRRLLWHGSRTSNYGGILSQGLRIAPPEAPATGYMFGKGIYFADLSSKSASYCHSFVTGNVGILLLCEVELGDPMYEPNGCDYDAGENAKEEGKIATLGRGSTCPGGWKDAGCVHESLKGVKMPDLSRKLGSDNSDFLAYNEYIVYDVAQVRQRYLFYIKMSY